MKILLIAPFFYENSVQGSIRYLFNLAEILSENHQVTIFTTKSKKISYNKFGQAEWKGKKFFNDNLNKKVNIKRFTVQKSNSLIYNLVIKSAKIFGEKICFFISKILQNHFDIFFYENLGPSIPEMEKAVKNELNNFDFVILSSFPFKTINSFSKIFKKNNKAFCILPFFHEKDIFHKKNFLNNALKKTNFILELNQNSINFLENKYKKPAYNLGGFIEPLKPISYKEISNFKNKLGIKDKFVIIYIGRKQPEKNYEIIIKAKNKINDKNIVLIMIGEEIDKKPIKNNGVIYLGKTDEKTKFLALASSDVFVNMSENESFGIVFLEAWYFGLPVIANKNCASSCDLITNNNDGFLCKNENDLAEKILFLKNNSFRKKEIGSRGKKNLENKFSKENFKKNLSGILEKII